MILRSHRVRMPRHRAAPLDRHFEVSPPFGGPNLMTGHEFSAVAGFTYKNQYQNGIDFHVDWGASKFLSKQVFVGVVGYYYQQITDDFGQTPILGGFRSRSSALALNSDIYSRSGTCRGYLNLKAYGELDAANRPSGWNTWLTFSISPMAPAAATPSRHPVTK